jgi:hypothetical protein
LKRKGLAALLGFENEVVLLVEIDEAAGEGAVGVADFDGFVEDVGVEVFDALRGLGAVDAEEVAELGEEELIVGALGAVGLMPAFNEALGRGGH